LPDRGEPQTTRGLSDKLGLHQSSVSHALKALMEEDLVIKKGKSYRLSCVGIIQKNTLEWMGKTLKCLKDHKDFFLSHYLSGIPPGFQVTMGVVCESREIIENDPVMPNHTPPPGKLQRFPGGLIHPGPGAPEDRGPGGEGGGHMQTVTSERIRRELRLKGSIYSGIIRFTAE